MPLATLPGGDLIALDCYIVVPQQGSADKKVTLKVLPEISDRKSASYNDEPVIGRSFPIKTYSHSENRSISMKVHFLAINANDIQTNLINLRLLQSATYPQESDTVPYQPPPICRIKCGQLLTSDNNGELCVVIKDVAVSFPTDVVYDPDTYLPYKFDVDLTCDAVFASTALPGQSKIISDTPFNFVTAR